MVLIGLSISQTPAKIGQRGVRRGLAKSHLFVKGQLIQVPIPQKRRQLQLMCAEAAGHGVVVDVAAVAEDVDCAVVAVGAVVVAETRGGALQPHMRVRVRDSPLGRRRSFR